MTEFRSGFVSIIGSPNVGKSTLMNALVGQKVSIVTDRAQTTRNRITGVVTGKDYQIVFLDTPGITQPRSKLGEYMYKAAYDSLESIEAVLFVADAKQGVREKDEAVLASLSRYRIPKIAAVNKIDAADESAIRETEERLKDAGCFDSVVRISALRGDGTELLTEELKKYLVPGPMYFPEDMVTDQPERNLCAEIIREKALLLLREEIPHGIGVGIDKMEVRETGALTDIYATIYCERESHKGIIIGRQGKMLKRIGLEARKDMESLLDCHVNLQLWVKYKEDWRNKPSVLHELGYE